MRTQCNNLKKKKKKINGMYGRRREMRYDHRHERPPMFKMNYLQYLIFIYERCTFYSSQPAKQSLEGIRKALCHSLN